MRTSQSENITCTALKHLKNQKLYEIILLKERVALLQKESQNIEQRANPLKSKLLKNVEESKRLYEDIKQKEQEYKQFIQSEKEKEYNAKRQKKNFIQFSSNEALKFARQHVQQEKKEQAYQIKQLHQQDKLMIKKNKDQQMNEKIQKKCQVLNEEKQAQQKIKEFQQIKQENFQKITQFQKLLIQQDLYSQEQEIKALEEQEMRFLQKLQQSKSQQLQFKNQVKDAMELNVEDYKKKYPKKKK
ncbi:unnamed protein product [Paramecium primaurelia]|uniref:Uncharacterized protein n=1 Tax=Paramecium primaurelia TaxID=5886 RepID=A0A8S1MBW6_PARPR|nr:unnamed protein product [Paramecium primaurelia]